ncbi:hypothetical protein EJ377_19695 [Chryseobacterium arthrosphaerae]|uniref:Uncharacterized protein n=1 Tax=Chryseobacterium arthrosphaerae TaxID=651561 RepID=A0A432DTU1_9FLAO|nr:hypothetical protein EJ377_19695 [Chryseobacterium arthrosphaerae]
MNPESDAFNKKIDEISSLAAEIGSTVANIEVDKHFNSPEWKNQMKELENLNPLDKKQLRRIEKEAARAGREAAKIVSKLQVPPTPPVALRHPKLLKYCILTIML